MAAISRPGAASVAALVLMCHPRCFDPQGPATTGESSSEGASTPADATAGPTQPTPTTTAPGPTGSSTADDPTTAATTDPGPGEPTGTSTGGGPPLPACEQLGGMPGIAALAASLHQRVRADDRINAYFLNKDVVPSKFETCLAKHIGQAVGCEGIVDDCGSLQRVHAGLGISANDHADFVEDFVAALTDHEQSLGVELGDQKDALVALFAGTSAEIVEDPGNDKTVYQRVGRNPALLALMGAPSQVGSFLQRMTANASLGGYFLGGFDGERARTCYPRKLGSLIGGPMKYGQEVTIAPVCADVAAVHVGVNDPMNANALLGITEFMEMLTELVAAMDAVEPFASAAPADKMAVYAAFAGLCESIVATPNDCAGTSESVVVDGMAGLPLDIPDYDGDQPEPLCHTVTVPATGIDRLLDARVRLRLSHPWNGDLTIHVVTPDAKSLKLLDRPGVSGMNQVGYGGVLDPDHEITFSDGGTFNAALMGQSYQPGQIVCTAENPCTFYPPQTGDLFTQFAHLAGIDTPGQWQLCVTDHGEGKFGKLHGVALELDKVKYPL